MKPISYAVVAIAALGLAVGAYYLGIGHGKAIITDQYNRGLAGLPGGLQPPGDTFSLVGEIKSVGSNYILFQEKHLDGFKGGAHKVFVNSETEIIGIDYYNEGQPPVLKYEQILITFQDLKEGDLVSVTADENIANNTEFTAIGIERHTSRQ